METVVLEQGQKDLILDDLQDYLFHGVPGTGKRSLFPLFSVDGLANLSI